MKVFGWLVAKVYKKFFNANIAVEFQVPVLSNIPITSRENQIKGG